MKRSLLQRSLLLTILPAALVALAFGVFFVERRDYLGHFAAGYGATLGLFLLVAAALPRDRFTRWLAWLALPVTAVAIALGAVCETTMFRLAKFDEVDFCNQSLGAVLAILACLAALPAKPSDVRTAVLGIVASAFLAVGFYYAFT